MQCLSIFLEARLQEGAAGYVVQMCVVWLLMNAM